mgnify:CR=1 FL=1|tara:strand:- start:800 stop:994 length:195 start_codon:yes stop_codon:yes gene_type:complete
MKVGDLVRLTPFPGTPMKPNLGIVTYIDPEEIGDNEEVEVKWTSGFHDCSNHSTWNLEMINEQD